MDDMIQLIGTTGPVKNYVDASKMITFTVDRKYREQLHQVDDLFNTEVVIQIIPREKAEAMLKEAEQKQEDEPEPESVEEVTYQSPDEEKDLNYLRSKIFLELKKAGLELVASEIYQAIVRQKQLHNCTIDELEEIWHRITNGKPEPDQNRTNLRSRMLHLIGGM